MQSQDIGVILAVLRFSGIQREEEKVLQYFEEDLVYHLSKFQGISVLSYQTTSELEIGDIDTLERYKVSHIVSGSYRKVREKVVLNTQLLDVENNVVIYEQRIEFKNNELFKLLDETILQVINTLQARLNHSILSKSYRKPEIDLKAHELFLLGSSSLKKSTPESDAEARAYFEKALKMQPDFARAYSGISSSYFNEWSCQLWDRWEVSQNGSKKYALKAIEVDENDYISLSILGRVLLFEGDYSASEYYLRKSLEMNSNDSSILLQIAFSFIFLGFTEEAVALYERACLLNPLNEDRYVSVGATLHFENGSFEKALKMGEKLEIDNTYIDFPIYLAAACYYLGDTERAHFYWNHYLRKYKSHIYLSTKEHQKDPLSWHIGVNPYQYESKLKPFWKYIQSIEGFDLESVKEEKQITTGKFFQSGSQLTIQLGKSTVTLKKTKGLSDIMKLIINPNKDIHSLELMGAMNTPEDRINILDEKSKEAYQTKIQSLQAELAEAEQMNDAIRANELSIEYEELLAHLTQSLGIDGKSRKVATPADKARAAVTLRIRDSINKIAKKDGKLGLHFKNSIKTGMLCSYRPEVSIQWGIEGF